MRVSTKHMIITCNNVRILPSSKKAATNMPLLRTLRRSVWVAPSLQRMVHIPITAQTMPDMAIQKGSAMPTLPCCLKPSTELATMEPTKEEYRSAPIPATSPTLSPTLSAAERRETSKEIRAFSQQTNEKETYQRWRGCAHRPQGNPPRPCRPGQHPRQQPW